MGQDIYLCQDALLSVHVEDAIGNMIGFRVNDVIVGNFAGEITYG